VQRPGGARECGGTTQFTSVHLDSFFMPLPVQRQVLHPSSALYDKPGQQVPSTEAGRAAGHVVLVQAAPARQPSKHRHTFTPSPAGNEPPVVHVSEGSTGAGTDGQASSVQLDSFLKPLHAHVHVLQPSTAAKTAPGQQRPSSLGGASGQAKDVQLASAFLPEWGHVHVLTPSPAGNATNGMHSSAGPRLQGGQTICVHLDSFFSPLPAQTHALQPSAASKGVPTQHSPSCSFEEPSAALEAKKRSGAAASAPAAAAATATAAMARMRAMALWRNGALASCTLPELDHNT